MEHTTDYDQQPGSASSADLKTSGRAGLLIVAAGMGLLAAVGVARRLVERRSVRRE